MTYCTLYDYLKKSRLAIESTEKGIYAIGSDIMQANEKIEQFVENVCKNLADAFSHLLVKFGYIQARFR